MAERRMSCCDRVRRCGWIAGFDELSKESPPGTMCKVGRASSIPVESSTVTVTTEIIGDDESRLTKACPQRELIAIISEASPIEPDLLEKIMAYSIERAN